MKNRYELITYSFEDKNILENTLLTNEENETIKELKILQKDRAYCCVIEDFYKFHKNNYSTSELGVIFNVSTRQIQNIFKELGINRNQIEAQNVSMINRDHEKISKTYKNTLLEKLSNSELSETSLEVQIRHQLDVILRNRLPNCEIVVAISSMNIVNEESNIPIIIIDNNYLYKFVVEIGEYTFGKKEVSNKKEKNKNSKAFYKGYTLFKLNTHNYLKSGDNPSMKYENEIKHKIVEIVNSIENEVIQASSVTKLQ